MFDMVQLGDAYLSTHQKIQLLGGGLDKAREIIKTLMEMEELFSIEDVRFIDCHAPYGVPMEQTKGKMVD